MRIALLFVFAALGCGASPPAPATPAETGSDREESGEAPAVPITPERAGPPALDDAEKKELSGPCYALENDFYEAGKVAIAELDARLAAGTEDAPAEQEALSAAIAALEGKSGGLGAPERERCLEIFEKQTRRRLFEHEPAEAEARSAIDSCMKRAVAAFGKERLAFEEGSGSGQASHGPFCPDDFPVPTSLAQLPYQSTAADWDTPAWKCLAFGLRNTQAFQIEYTAPIGEGTFRCIARFLPRQGGAPIELSRGGKVSEAGELLVEEKTQRGRMKPGG